MMYFSGSTRQFFNRPDLFGVMFNISFKMTKGIDALEQGCNFFIDNGIYANKFNPVLWYSELVSTYLPYKHNCYGVIIPDYLYYLPNKQVRGDWQKTLKRFYLFYPYAKYHGFKIAYASQDGQPVDLVPWDKIDVLFIGGSDYHKRGLEAEKLALKAKQLGKHVHVGRVSSVSAIKKYFGWADSWDGTTFIYEPDKKEEKLIPQFEKYLNSKDYQNKNYQSKMF